MVPVYGSIDRPINAAFHPNGFMTDGSDSFENLGPAAQATAAIVRRPYFAAHIVVGTAVALSWVLLLAMAARNAAAVPASAGPGGELLRLLPALPLPSVLEHFFRLCLAPANIDAPVAWNFAALWLMWFLMALAMMLPSAAPMIRTYCEIADTASARGGRTVHPLVLVAGYLAVWCCASLGLAGLSLAIQAGPALSQPLGPAGGLTGAAVLLIAGLYQFSGFKDACLTRCRNPFAILFSRWSEKPERIFTLGMEQGLWCLGCCWALMLVMFAVGLMNVFWTALIALFTVVEKQLPGRLPSRIAGAILLVWAAALLLVSH